LRCVHQSFPCRSSSAPAPAGAESIVVFVRPLRGGLPGAAFTLSSDAFQKFRGWLVVRILRNKLAGEGMAQDGLPQRLGLMQLGVKAGFECSTIDICSSTVSAMDSCSAADGKGTGILFVSPM